MGEQRVMLQPGTVISIDGPFDTAAATALRRRIAAAAGEECVALDFGHARDVQDLALASLAYGLVADRRENVRFRGLSHHHERMLRYLGVDAPAFGIASPARQVLSS